MTNETSKMRVSVFWCSSCGGCDETIVDLNHELLQLADEVEIVLWPLVVDYKYEHLPVMPDGHIDVSLINGAIQTEEQLSLARLLREKSRIIVAFGSCAHTGGVPGLANLTTREHVFDTVYCENVTTVNKQRALPSQQSTEHGMTLTLPDLLPSVHALNQCIDVDYYLPGCPPPVKTVSVALSRLLSNDLPARGTVLGSEKPLCDTCGRKRADTPDTYAQYRMPHEIVADPEMCFLDQGILCCGPATRAGCDNACIGANMPCTGCMGSLDAALDIGAQMTSVASGMISGNTDEDVRSAVSSITDIAGTMYRYAVPSSPFFCRNEEVTEPKEMRGEQPEQNELQRNDKG